MKIIQRFEEVNDKEPIKCSQIDNIDRNTYQSIKEIGERLKQAGEVYIDAIREQYENGRQADEQRKQALMFSTSGIKEELDLQDRYAEIIERKEIHEKELATLQEKQKSIESQIQMEQQLQQAREEGAKSVKQN